MLYLFLFIISFEFVLDFVLDYLNLKSQKPVLPVALQDIYDKDKYISSLEYHKEKTKFGFLTSTISFVVAFVLLYTGAFGAIDLYLRSFFSNEIVLALAFFGVLYFGSDILSIPIQVYSTFVIEEKYGFNKTSPKTFIIDKIKGALLTIIFGGLIIALLLWLILSLGQSFWIYFLVVLAILMLLLNMFYASWIVPIFNKLTPLKEGSLKAKIEEYSKTVNFPLDNIFVIDGSKRSSKSNAFFSGIGKKKKIVFYDTLLDNHTEEEVVAILAHEVGHYKKKHIVGSFILSLIQMGLMLYILSLMVFNPALSRALGAETLSVHLNILAFAILYSPVSKILGLVMNMISRKNEYEADAYAAKTADGTALRAALKKLSVNNLSNLMPHWLYVFFHYSHPPLLKRLKALSENTLEKQY